MLKTILIDDEKQARVNLKAFLDRLDVALDVIGEAANVEEAYREIKEKSPELIFLDIEMPGGSGFDLLLMFDDWDFEVIFVTAYDHYAIQAIKFSALWYILKPINIEELTQAVDKAIKARENKTKSPANPAFMRALTEHLKGTGRFDKLFIPDMSGFSVVKTASVLYLKADGHYTEIITDTGKIVCSKSLKEFRDLLPPEKFYRISKSYIINTDYMAKYQKGSGGIVVMEDGHEIDVPRRGKHEFLQFLNQI